MSQDLVKEYEILKKRSEQLTREVSKMEGAIETMLRTLKRRFGIAAPRVAVYTKLPAHVRLIGILVAALLVVGLAWIT